MRVDSSLYNKERISYSSFSEESSLYLQADPSAPFARGTSSCSPSRCILHPVFFRETGTFRSGRTSRPYLTTRGPVQRPPPAGMFHKRMPPTTESDTPSCSFFPSSAATASGMIALGERLPFGPSDPGPILRQPDLRIALIFRPSPSAARSDARSTEALSDVFPPAGTDRAARCGLPPPRPGSFIIRLSHHFSSSRIAPRPIFISLPQASGPPHLATSYFFCNVLR